MARCRFTWLGLVVALVSCLSAQAAEGLWLTHYTREGGGFTTTINLINTDFGASQQVTLTPYADDGTRLDHLSVTVAVDPGGRLSLQRADLNWEDRAVSHVRLDAPATVRAGAGYRAEVAGAMSAQVRLADTPATQVRMVPETNEAWFDGLVAMNPGDTPTTLTLSAHDAMGNTTRATAITLQAGGKWLGVPKTLLGDSVDPDGYLMLHAENPLHFLALRGSGSEVGPPVLTEVALDAFTAELPELTYANQISRIIDRTCVSCHREGGLGPFELENYETVYPMRAYLREAVHQGIMPPWKASEDCEPLLESRAMDPLEKQQLLDWLSGEAGEGDKTRTPPARDWPEADWSLGEPDLALSYTQDYNFEPGPDVYRCFPIPLGNTETLQLAALEVLPGNPEIVHHVLLYISNDTGGQQLDTAEAGPGYTCFGGPGTAEIRGLGGWAPGAGPMILPENAGMTIAPGATIIMQVHYHYGAAAGADRTRLGLYFTQQERPDEMLLLPLVNQEFVIPPGDESYFVTKQVTLPLGVSADLYGVQPHMHLLGKSIWVEAFLPGGEVRCLVDVPVWDFNWQTAYRFQQPFHLPQGTTLKLSCLFDNSKNNPSNPYDPPQPVGWGEETTDEMALAILALTLPFDIYKHAPELQQLMDLGARPANPALPDAAVRAPFRKTNPLPASCCSPEKERPWCADKKQ